MANDYYSVVNICNENPKAGLLKDFGSPRTPAWQWALANGNTLMAVHLIRKSCMMPRCDWLGMLKQVLLQISQENLLASRHEKLIEIVADQVYMGNDASLHDYGEFSFGESICEDVRYIVSMCGIKSKSDFIEKMNSAI